MSEAADDVVAYALAAAANPLVLLITFVVLTSDRGRTEGVWIQQSFGVRSRRERSIGAGFGPVQALGAEPVAVAPKTEDLGVVAQSVRPGAASDLLLGEALDLCPPPVLSDCCTPTT